MRPKGRRKGLAKNVSSKLGMTALYFSNVMNVIDSLDSLKISPNAVRRLINGHKIKPQELGINPEDYELSDSTVRYRADGLYNILQSLNETGKINLPLEGIDGLDTMLSRAYSFPANYEEEAIK